MPTVETELERYLQSSDFPLQPATTVYPLNDTQVLLGKKIKVDSLGEGYFLGFGGKPKPRDKGKINVTAQREVREEAGIKIRLSDLTHMGKAFFYFPFQKWAMEVTLFTVRKWIGEPRRTREMDPKWFDRAKVPYDQMWDDSKLFLPHLLMGRRLETHILYGADNKTVHDYSLRFL